MPMFQLQINAAELLSELTFVQSAISKRYVIPVLKFALFEWVGTTLKMTGTDLEIACQSNITVNDSLERTRFLADPDALLKLLKGGEDEEAHIMQYDEGLYFEYDGVRLTLETMDAETFPEVPTEPKERIRAYAPSMSSDKYGMQEVAQKILPAISKEESRFTINGALLEYPGIWVSTDGHRLSVFDGSHSAKSDVEGYLKAQQEAALQAEPNTTFISHGQAQYCGLIPTQALALAAKYIPDAAVNLWGLGPADSAAKPGTRGLYRNKAEYASITDYRRTIIARSLTGNFPDWRRVIGTHASKHLGMTDAKPSEPAMHIAPANHDRVYKQLSKLLKIAPSNHKQNGNPMFFSVALDGLTDFYLYDAGKQHAKMQLPFNVDRSSDVQTITGALSLVYFLDALKMFEGSDYTITCVDRKDPKGGRYIMDCVVITAPRTAHILMAMRDMPAELERKVKACLDTPGVTL